jgi:hypothetical protein
MNATMVVGRDGIIKTKRCLRCRKEKHVSDFSLLAANTQDINYAQSYCKKCANVLIKLWRKKNPEKYKAAKALRRKAHPEWKVNPEKERARKALYRKNNKEKIKEYNALYYEKKKKEQSNE